MPTVDNATDTFLTVSKEWGIFAGLFILLLLFILVGFFFLAKAYLKLHADALEKIIQNNEENTNSNTVIANSSRAMTELLQNLLKQIDNTNSDLKFVRKVLQRNNQLNSDIVCIIKCVFNGSEKSEINYRFESIEKEIERPIE